MERKLVKHGPNTLTVSLPSKWVKSHNLKNGQKITVNQLQEGLLITPQKRIFERIEITITKKEDWYLEKMLRHLYTSGYDEIIINYEDKSQLKLIRESLTLLTGLEVVESGTSFCRIRCTISLDESEYEQTVKRMLWIILSHFDYFIEDCQKGRLEMHAEVGETFNTFARLCNLCRRLINTRQVFDYTNSRYAYEFMNSLIEVSLNIRYSYDYLSRERKASLSIDELEFIKKVRNLYYDMLMSYQNRDIGKTREVLIERKKMFPEITNILFKKNPVILHYFLVILRNFTPIGTHILMLYIDESKKN